MIYLASPFNGKDLIHIDRNFFGVVKVLETPTISANAESKQKVRAMMHGTTLHGFEALDKDYAYKPGSYYTANGPLGEVIKINNPKSIAALGLGVGQIACYKDRETTFFEIDPHVVDIALTQFTVLKTCGYKDIILGDARLELSKDTNKYDLIVVDTFSSDSIPIHLITKEAFNLYTKKTNQNGAIIINISNRHLDLTTPLAQIAQEMGLMHRSKHYNPKEEDIYDTASQWFVITLNENLIKTLDQSDWKTTPPNTHQRIWTDDYSNILSTFKIIKRFTSRQKNKEEKE
jgi:spermidine synthase